MREIGGEAGEQLNLVAEQHGACRRPDRPGCRAGRRAAEVGQGRDGALSGGSVERGKLQPAYDEDGALGQAGRQQVGRAQQGLAADPEAGVAPRATLGGAHDQLANPDGHRPATPMTGGRFVAGQYWLATKTT